jgi:hypothetical protein
MQGGLDARAREFPVRCVGVMQGWRVGFGRNGMWGPRVCVLMVSGNVEGRRGGPRREGGREVGRREERGERGEGGQIRFEYAR